MKRIFLTIALVLLTGLITFGQTIEVLLPKSPDDVPWYKGHVYRIKWTKSGQMNQIVKIHLVDYPGVRPLFEISDNTPNDGEFNWRIPEAESVVSPRIEPKYYAIRVQTIDDAVSGVSSSLEIWPSPNQPGRIKKLKNKVFLTKSKTSLAKAKNVGQIRYTNIKVIQPSKKVFWTEGRSYYIEWKNALTKSKPIRIDLYNSSGKKFLKNIKTIKPSGLRMTLAQTSKIRWTIPNNKFTMTNKYRIKISRIDVPSIFGFSNIFTIKNN